MRDYVVPDKGHVLIDRDYSQQELRIFAHYAEGGLAAAYERDPDLDMHDTVRDIIKEVTGFEMDRKAVKVCNFLTLYGGGVQRLADQLDCTYTDAEFIKSAHKRALPEIAALQRDINAVYRHHGYIRTWGGRKYRVDQGFEYKLLNALIQGSAADQTKEAIRRLEFSNSSCRLMLQVHDELLVSAPARSAKSASEQLREAMCDMSGWDVPMRTDVSISERWGE
jgi:DNA polymerase-1